jgi:hypothetical protein
MKIFNRSLTTIAAILIGGTLSGAALSQVPASPGATQPDMSAYHDAMKAMKASYKDAAGKCRAMGAGAESRNCMADAKAARKVDTANAKQLRTAAVTSNSRMGGGAGMPGSPVAK